jgi:F-type H+-transporting ATPase subunit a
VFEVIIEALADLAEQTMGPNYRKYFPIIGSIFFFLLIANVMGLIPWVGGASSAVEVAGAWALMSFAVYNYVGIREHGLKYIYHFMGPALYEAKIGGKTYHMRLMAPLFLPLELILHAARVLTLSVRLVANMFADHTVVAVWIGMVPIAVPAIFMGLGLLVAFLQAFVFSLLTMIYIGEAMHEAH